MLRRSLIRVLHTPVYRVKPRRAERRAIACCRASARVFAGAGLALLARLHPVEEGAEDFAVAIGVPQHALFGGVHPWGFSVTGAASAVSRVSAIWSA